MTKPVSDFKFQEPPPKRAPRYDWVALAEQARSQPNEWVKVFDKDVRSLYTTIKQGALTALPTDEFEVRTANNDRKAIPPTCALYVRYAPKKGGTK